MGGQNYVYRPEDPGQFEAVVESQRKRIADMKAQDDFIDYSKLDKLIIGVCGGDGSAR